MFNWIAQHMANIIHHQHLHLSIQSAVGLLIHQFNKCILQCSINNMVRSTFSFESNFCHCSLLAVLPLSTLMWTNPYPIGQSPSFVPVNNYFEWEQVFDCHFFWCCRKWCIQWLISKQMIFRFERKYFSKKIVSKSNWLNSSIICYVK